MKKKFIFIWLIIHSIFQFSSSINLPEKLSENEKKQVLNILNTCNNFLMPNSSQDIYKIIKACNKFFRLIASKNTQKTNNALLKELGIINHDGIIDPQMFLKSLDSHEAVMTVEDFHEYIVKKFKTVVIEPEYNHKYTPELVALLEEFLLFKFNKEKWHELAEAYHVFVQSYINNQPIQNPTLQKYGFIDAQGMLTAEINDEFKKTLLICSAALTFIKLCVLMN